MGKERHSSRPPYESAEESGWDIRTTEHGPFYDGPGKVTIYTRSYYDEEGRYRGAVPDPEGGAPYGWHVVNGQLKPVDPFD